MSGSPVPPERAQAMPAMLQHAAGMPREAAR